AGGPHTRGTRAGPSAGGYGSAALFLISPVRHPSRVAGGGQPGPLGPALPGTVRIPAAVGHHPKVPAGWDIAARRASPEGATGQAGVRCQGSGRAAGVRAAAAWAGGGVAGLHVAPTTQHELVRKRIRRRARPDTRSSPRGFAPATSPSAGAALV